MSHVSHRLKGPLEGALAGGGDPATSPLYVFGPFLRLLVVAGVAAVSFGAAIWLAVLTVVMVSAMYRLVMIWVTDGSGGSGLGEDEFGPWAVKVNAGITVVEYTLTFLVSMAAMVTFIADRLPFLNEHLAGIPLRTLVAILFSLLIGFAVNRGPKVAARAFGPATAGVLILLWVMIIATIWKLGFHLPNLDLAAFNWDNLHFTLGGYARILALMTGIEIFANLVAAYEGPAKERSKSAFGSLLIIMITTSLTMLIVGPAIYAMSDPFLQEVSVFTQTMDQLLPTPLAYAGTLVGVAVLLSACAASAQGIQNLALGLRYRHYIPASLGQRNKYDVANKPVWLEVAVCIFCFLLFGTHEETYLALYAAGVFILLSLTGWAAIKRLVREVKKHKSLKLIGTLAGTLLAAILTTVATLIIFEERFLEGAWAYLLFIPSLYWAFSFFRNRLGKPNRVEDRLGSQITYSYLPPLKSEKVYAGITFKNILVPLDQSPQAEQSLPIAQSLARSYNGRIRLLTVVQPKGTIDPKGPSLSLTNEQSAREYLLDVVADLRGSGYQTSFFILEGSPAQMIGDMARDEHTDILVMATHGRSSFRNWLVSDITSQVIHQTTPPLLVVRPSQDWHSMRTRFARLLVALDGSEIAEQVLPHVHELAARYRSEVILLSVSEGSESEEYPKKLEQYLEVVAKGLRDRGITVRYQVTGSGPARTILEVALAEKSDLIMMVSHGRGGVDRQGYVKLGSVSDRVLEETLCPVFLVSALPPASSLES